MHPSRLAIAMVKSNERALVVQGKGHFWTTAFRSGASGMDGENEAGEPNRIGRLILSNLVSVPMSPLSLSPVRERAFGKP